ncbi:MAG: RHS repeat-associated core domain-containing protein [Pirellula sp.]
MGNLTYTWDTNKNKKSESIGGVMSGYGFTNAGTTYDDEDRLTGYQRTNGALSQSWNLTSVGDWNSVTTNGTAQSRTHGPTHELLTAGGQTVNTDVKGNITLLPAVLASSLSPQASSLQWDFDNKLKSVDVGNNSSTDVEYKYDALGRRVARVGSSGSFVYVQSDQQTIADYGVGDAPSSPLYRYVYASYIDEPVVRKGAGTGGTIHYFHRNQQYSITAVTTSTGAIAERYAYSAYGEPTICDASGSVIASSTINNRYTYTGREWDATVGLHHFRARWMSPRTGRFITRDPIVYEGSEWGLYEFVDGNSLSALDPKGLSIFNPHPSVTRTIPYACIAPNWSNHFVAAGTCTCTFPPPNNSPLGGFFQTAAFATCTEKACVASIYSVCGQFYASLMQPNEMGIKTQACLRARFGAAVTCECT